MLDCPNYNGDDLLKLFQDLNVNIGNLPPNVIRGWFDIDDENVRNALNWMCLSLSKDNVLTPLEQIEFNNLETPLNSSDLVNATTQIESHYPGIFDVETNLCEIQFIEDELDLLRREKTNRDECLFVNKQLQKNLCKELSRLSKKKDICDAKYEETERLCLKLAEELDVKNEKLHKQFVKYASYLYTFEFDEEPIFINRMDLTEFMESLDNFAGYLNIIVQRQYQDLVENNLVNSKIASDSSTSTNSSSDNLQRIKNSIEISHNNYIKCKHEEECLRGILTYIEKLNLKENSTPNPSESFMLECTIESKIEQTNLMFNMLESKTSKMSEYEVSQSKVAYAQKELEKLRFKIEYFNTIDESVPGILANCITTYMLYLQEKNDINNSDKFFREIFNCISTDLKSIRIRTKAMNNTIEEYKLHCQKPVEQKFQIFKSLTKVLSNKENLNLSGAYSRYLQNETEIKELERKLYVNDWLEKKRVADKVKKNIQILNRFLVSGPTCRVVVLPLRLQFIIQEAKTVLEKQASAVKWLLQLSLDSTKKLESDKWLKNSRLLWVYFLTDPVKMHGLIKQIQDENKKQTIKFLQFND